MKLTKNALYITSIVLGLGLTPVINANDAVKTSSDTKDAATAMNCMPDDCKNCDSIKAKVNCEIKKEEKKALNGDKK